MEAEVIGALITGSTGVVGSVAAALIAKDSKDKAEKSEKKLKDNFKEQQEIFIELSTVMKEVAKTIEDPKIKVKINKSISSLDKEIGNLRNLLKDIDIWKEAGIWLESYSQVLINRAINDVLKKHSILLNLGRDLDSEEKKQIFQKSLEKHILWVILSLKNGIDIPLEIEKFPHISDRDAYKEAFTSIKFQIEKITSRSSYNMYLFKWFQQKMAKTKEKLSKEAAEVLKDFIDILMKQYT